MKTKRTKPTTCKIDSILYNFYLRLKDTLGAEIVHRRRRKSATCIEIIFHNDLYQYVKGRLNTLPEAESWGFWVMCRPQTRRNHGSWHGRAVFQLFLTPVHPKKRNEARYQAAQTSEEVTFEPILARPCAHRLYGVKLRPRTKNSSNSCIYAKKVVPLHANLDYYGYFSNSAFI